MKRILAVIALAGALSLGTSAIAAAEPVQVAPRAWVPVFYFGTQTYCTQAAMMGQQVGLLTPGGWRCDSGWLLTLQGGGSTPPPPATAP
jgi:hypothetical protein